MLPSQRCWLRVQEDTEEEPETPRGNRSPTRAGAASTALSRAFSSGLVVGRSASMEQPGTPTTSLRGLNTSGEHVKWASAGKSLR